MKKKISLHASHFEGYRLYGIVSPLKDYTLAYYINTFLEIHLVKYDDLALPDNKGLFSWYYYKQGNKYLSCFLIGNNHPRQKLLPALGNFDYFFLLKDAIEENQLQVMIGQLRKIQNVIGVFEQELSVLKEADELLESNELHEMEQIVSKGKKFKNKI